MNRHGKLIPAGKRVWHYPYPDIIKNISDECCLFNHCISRNMNSLDYWCLTCIGQLRRDGQCCARQAQCGRQTKITGQRLFTAPWPSANPHGIVWFVFGGGQTATEGQMQKNNHHKQELLVINIRTCFSSTYATPALTKHLDITQFEASRKAVLYRNHLTRHGTSEAANYVLRLAIRCRAISTQCSWVITINAVPNKDLHVLPQKLATCNKSILYI